MKKFLSTLALVIVVGVFATSPLPLRIVEAQTTEPNQPFETPMNGTYGVFCFANEVGVAIVNPKIVNISQRPFIVGTRSGKISQFSATPFTGGLTFISLDKVVSIQQLMVENE